MYKRVLFAITLVFILVICTAAYAAQPLPPSLPAFYYGKINDAGGGPVASGAIQAFIEGRLRGEVSFTGGEYKALMVEGEQSLTDKPVIFKVIVDGAEYEAASDPARVLWHGGDVSGTKDSNGKMTPDVDLTLGAKKGSSTPGGGSEDVVANPPVSDNPHDGPEKNSLPGSIIKLTIGQQAAMVNQSPYTMDAVPYEKDGRTLVPVRFISEALGAKVDWLAREQQVVITDGNSSIALTIGSTDVLVGKTAQALDVPPEITGGRTFVPVRFITENLGAKVDYNEITKDITITR